MEKSMQCNVIGSIRKVRFIMRNIGETKVWNLVNNCMQI